MVIKQFFPGIGRNAAFAVFSLYKGVSSLKSSVYSFSVNCLSTMELELCYTMELYYTILWNYGTTIGYTTTLLYACIINFIVMFV